MEELLKYYPNLLTIQYNSKNKAKATIEMLVKLLWANNMLAQIRDGFNIDTAEGVQLDVIGLWVGVDRYVYQKPYDNHPWLSLIDLSGASDTNLQGGFAELSNFDTTLGGFLTNDLAVGGTTATLSDDNFRFCIKLKIIKNSISHTCKNIDDAIYNLCGLNLITRWDTANHTLYYEYNPAWDKALIMTAVEKKNILPCPTGVKIVIQQQTTT